MALIKHESLNLIFDCHISQKRRRRRGPHLVGANMDFPPLMQAIWLSKLPSLASVWSCMHLLGFVPILIEQCLVNAYARQPQLKPLGIIHACSLTAHGLVGILLMHVGFSKLNLSFPSGSAPDSTGMFQPRRISTMHELFDSSSQPSMMQPRGFRDGHSILPPLDEG